MDIKAYLEKLDEMQRTCFLRDFGLFAIFPNEKIIKTTYDSNTGFAFYAMDSSIGFDFTGNLFITTHHISPMVSLRKIAEFLSGRNIVWAIEETQASS